MSLLVATPMYGGVCDIAYFQGCLDLKEFLVGEGIAHDWLVVDKESLVQRARNTIAAAFLQTDYRKLLFIDADIGFTVDDVGKLWNLDTDVAVGVYPMKRMDKCWYAAWVNGKLVTDLDFDGPVEVDYAGTGFMMIDRGVFEKMKSERIRHEEGSGECWAFFDPRVENGVYLSEDYAFCEDWRKLGGKVVMDPTVKLSHIGKCEYGPELAAKLRPR
ncbi:MAG: hypothetical protein ACE5FS_03500 [Paracoccaceae bacterium]